MNVASLELCKELYKVSGWKYDAYFDLSYIDGNLKHHVEGTVLEGTPAYPLGYLLRKLPYKLTLPGLYYVGDHKNNDFTLEMEVPSSGEDYWCFFYSNGGCAEYYPLKGATPEDAAAKLLVELFKQGVLIKGVEA
jgi:hypothetical protein